MLSHFTVKVLGSDVDHLLYSGPGQSWSLGCGRRSLGLFDPRKVLDGMNHMPRLYEYNTWSFNAYGDT